MLIEEQNQVHNLCALALLIPKLIAEFRMETPQLIDNLWKFSAMRQKGIK